MVGDESRALLQLQPRRGGGGLLRAAAARGRLQRPDVVPAGQGAGRPDGLRPGGGGPAGPRGDRGDGSHL